MLHRKMLSLFSIYSSYRYDAQVLTFRNQEIRRIRIVSRIKQNFKCVSATQILITFCRIVFVHSLSGLFLLSVSVWSTRGSPLFTRPPSELMKRKSAYRAEKYAIGTVMLTSRFKSLCIFSMRLIFCHHPLPPLHHP